VAVRENKLKLTPPWATVAPKGELRPINLDWYGTIEMLVSGAADAGFATRVAISATPSVG
jgi:hypothetical protein